MSKRSTVLAAAFIACIGAHASANLLNNPGFESDLGFDFSNPFNWNGFFGAPNPAFLEAFNTTGAAPRSGDKALVTTVRANPGQGSNGLDAFCGHVQIVTGIIAGETYELSVWARTNPTVLDFAEFRVEWQDASGVELGRKNTSIGSMLTSSYQLFSATDVAPAGAVKAAIVIAAASFHGPGYTVPADTSVAWDDASFDVIPAPGAAALFGAFGLVSLRRRRN
jgi:hypothetical protein